MTLRRRCLHLCRLPRGRQNVLGAERWSDAGGPTGVRSFPTIAQREPCTSSQGEGLNGAASAVPPASAASSPFSGVAPGNLASDTSALTAAAAPSPGMLKPRTSLPGGPPQPPTQPHRASYSGAPRLTLDTMSSGGLGYLSSEPRPSPTGAGSPRLPLVSRRVSLSSNADVPSREMGLLDR